MSAIPTTPAELHPDWLTALLTEAGHDVVVADVDIEPVGTGQMAGSFRLRLDYARGGEHLPATMVAKMATGDIGQREFVSGAFRNEVRFYRDLATTFAVPVPDCYASTISATGSEFVLLLEDMGAAVQGDQIAGCSPTQAHAIAVAAAGLHGPRWDDPLLVECFPLPTDDDRVLMDSVLAPMAEAYRERFSPGPEESATVDWLVERAGPWLVAPTSHTTLIHGDLRVDNVLFAPDGPGGTGAITVIDWQTITTGSPLRDIAFLLTSSLTVKDRRACERQIVESYRQALIGYGVANYSAEQCWADYVAGLLQTPLIVVFGAGAATPSERGDRMFETMMSRAAAAVADLLPDELW